MPKVIARPSDPILSTREIDVFFAVGWLGFAWWGLFSALFGVKTIVDPLGFWFSTVYSGIFSLLALLCSLIATSLFFRIGTISNLTKKKWEQSLAIGMFFFFLIYPVNIMVRALTDSAITPNLGIALVCLLVIFYRIRNLRYRIFSYVPVA